MSPWRSLSNDAASCGDVGRHSLMHSELMYCNVTIKCVIHEIIENALIIMLESRKQVCISLGVGLLSDVSSRQVHAGAYRAESCMLSIDMGLGAPLWLQPHRGTHAIEHFPSTQMHYSRQWVRSKTKCFNFKVVYGTHFTFAANFIIYFEMNAFYA